MSAPLFQGIIPPVPTLFDQAGRFDEAGMARLIDFLATSEVDALFFGGSAGEFSQMTSEQRRQVASFSVRHLAGRKKALVGIGSPSTDEAIRLGLHAQECGADGKEAIRMTGVEISTHVLPPAAPLSEDKRSQVRDLLRALAVITGSPPSPHRATG